MLLTAFNANTAVDNVADIWTAGICSQSELIMLMSIRHALTFNQWK